MALAVCSRDCVGAWSPCGGRGGRDEAPSRGDAGANTARFSLKKTLSRRESECICLALARCRVVTDCVNKEGPRRYIGGGEAGGGGMPPLPRDTAPASPSPAIRVVDPGAGAAVKRPRMSMVSPSEPHRLRRSLRLSESPP